MAGIGALCLRSSVACESRPFRRLAVFVLVGEAELTSAFLSSALRAFPASSAPSTRSSAFPSRRPMSMSRSTPSAYSPPVDCTTSSRSSSRPRRSRRATTLLFDRRALPASTTCRRRRRKSSRSNRRSWRSERAVALRVDLSPPASPSFPPWQSVALRGSTLFVVFCLNRCNSLNQRRGPDLAQGLLKWLIRLVSLRSPDPPSLSLSLHSVQACSPSFESLSPLTKSVWHFGVQRASMIGGISVTRHVTLSRREAANFFPPPERSAGGVLASARRESPRIPARADMLLSRDGAPSCHSLSLQLAPPREKWLPRFSLTC